MAPVSSSNRDDDFKSYNQTPFCKRARSRKPSHCSLKATNVSISNGDLTAKLIPNNDNPLLLSLSVYQYGILRLKIDEDPNLDPPKKRFEVNDVIVPEFFEKKILLKKIVTEVMGNDSIPSSIIHLADGFEAVIRHDPFEIFVREKGGKRVISLNSYGLFDFEQLRVKKEGDDWEEKFKVHTDSRPFGPQSISFDVSFHESDFVYGIPEHATSLALKPTRGPGIDQDSEPYRLFNLDVFEYLHDSSFGLYGSIPFMLSHGKSRGTSGFFWLNASEMQVDVLASGWNDNDNDNDSIRNRVDTVWMSEAGIVDTFFFVGPNPKDVIRQYITVTGSPALPQLFATGYHQCILNCRDEEHVSQVDSNFDEFDIPYDVLWLDIDHTDTKKCFTWDKLLFPNPEKMQNKLAGKGRHMVTIVDPHIKRDDSFPLHNEATKKGYYIKDSSSNDFDGWCWPGSSSYIDVVSPEIRSWWAGKLSFTSYNGSTRSLYIWNDMNEPSVFNGPEVTMPRDSLHVGGFEHRELHNAYGYYFNMATTDGLVQRCDGKDRPFVLSRAFFSGSQKYGAVWTGDNTANWEHLKVSVPMVLTLGLTGNAFSGADVGGFFGDPEPELLVRWYQLGCYYPFFRAHTHQDAERREPWLFGDRNTELIREAIQMRYTLLPYFYTLFREANTTGSPVMRPLWMEFASDKPTFTIDEAFMVGNCLLVQGIFIEKANGVSVYLPTEGGSWWYDLNYGIRYEGGKTYKLDVSEEHIPVFQRAGTIVPRKDRSRRSSTQMAIDPYTLVIALDDTQEAVGELYVDDGKSFEFANGAFIHRRFVFSNGELTSSNMVLSSVKSNGGYSSNCVIEKIILLGEIFGAKDAVIEPGNRKVEIVQGPLYTMRKNSPIVPIIRRPNVRISDDWTIRIL
ncbi:probable glucan 1,3-alpha-glucosidase [Impatiens glandulifera]|uniref:probable glucan 1,3-alpha-glucosidase n=1 Tax=Impatiens glandulifera TaxID=253017 RepID=UPI001FB09E0C|nr:probable glucan 1,3-alpha-glucosidase [Impatiens glandulifera]